MSKPVDTFPELDALRLSPEQLAELFESKRQGAPAPKETLPQWPKGKGFHYYRFPLWALERISLATKEPWLIVMLVLYRLWYKNGGYNPVRLSSQALQKFGLSRNHKLRALKLLRESGLIAIEQHTGKNPRITLKWTPR